MEIAKNIKMEKACARSCEIIESIDIILLTNILRVIMIKKSMEYARSLITGLAGKSENEIPSGVLMVNLLVLFISVVYLCLRLKEAKQVVLTEKNQILF